MVFQILCRRQSVSQSVSQKLRMDRKKADLKITRGKKSKWNGMGRSPLSKARKGSPQTLTVRHSDCLLEESRGVPELGRRSEEGEKVKNRSRDVSMTPTRGPSGASEVWDFCSVGHSTACSLCLFLHKYKYNTGPSSWIKTSKGEKLRNSCLVSLPFRP